MSTLKNIEVELMFPLNDVNILQEKLDAIAKKEKHNEYQKDTYYNPPHRNFLDENPVNEWLRIRETKKGVSINYKNFHAAVGEKVISCDEYETSVGDAESLKKIFLSLAFKELIVVEKSRSTWLYKKTEIAIDHVTGLYDTIELEAKGQFSSIEDAKKHLYAVLAELGARVGEQDYKGYPYLLLEKKRLL
ncbi:MAG: class IV adenylate cyclase [Patescibacteria group bacterium]|jgi:adenylate cyclase class 2